MNKYKLFLLPLVMLLGLTTFLACGGDDLTEENVTSNNGVTKPKEPKEPEEPTKPYSNGYKFTIRFNDAVNMVGVKTSYRTYDATKYFDIEEAEGDDVVWLDTTTGGTIEPTGLGGARITTGKGIYTNRWTIIFQGVTNIEKGDKLKVKPNMIKDSNGNYLKGTVTLP